LALYGQRIDWWIYLHKAIVKEETKGGWNSDKGLLELLGNYLSYDAFEIGAYISIVVGTKLGRGWMEIIKGQC